MGLRFSAGVEESCKPMYDRRMNVTLTTFHDRVHWLLRQRDMSQKELAAAVGVSEQFLSALLKGKRKPNVRRLSAMALLLQTSVDFLALLSDDPTPPQAAPEPAPVYFSPEADAAAQIDVSPDDDGASALAAQIERQRAIISSAATALERAADAYTDGTMTAENYRRQQDRKGAQIDAAEAEIERLQQKAAAEHQRGSRRTRLESAAAIGLAMLDHPDPATANAYLRTLLRVTIHRNRVQAGEWL